MKKISILFVLFFGMLSTVSSQTKNFIDQSYLETKAVVDTSVMPDRIYLDITISEKNSKGKNSIEEIEAKMILALTNIGINIEKNLSLNDFASNFDKYFLKQQDILKEKSFTLIVEDASTAGEVMVELEKINISNIEINKVEYTKIENLKLELRRKAILQAKKQAEYMLKPLNQKVGAAIFISDKSISYVSSALQGRVAGVNIRSMANGESIAKSNRPINIRFEKIEIECVVLVMFKIE